MPNFNPMQMLINQITNNLGLNPMTKNVIDMAKKNDVSGLEQFARNLGKEKGADVDALYKQVCEKMGVQN